MIVLDTHVLVWWVNGGPELSKSARTAIEKERQDENGLTLMINVDDWLETLGEIDGVRFMPVDNEVAIQSTRLPGEFHPDPADRMIVALARHLSVPLVTADTKILAYKHGHTIW